MFLVQYRIQKFGNWNRNIQNWDHCNSAKNQQSRIWQNRKSELVEWVEQLECFMQNWQLRLMKFRTYHMWNCRISKHQETEHPIIGKDPDNDPVAEFTMLSWIISGKVAFNIGERCYFLQTEQIFTFFRV